MLACNSLQSLHYDMVMIQCYVTLCIDWCKFMLSRCNFVVLCLRCYTNFPEFFVNIFHESCDSLADGGFEDVYGNLGITGTPFFISEIDGVYYVPFQGESNGIVTFELSDNGEITDINMLYEFDEVVQSSLDRYYSKY